MIGLDSSPELLRLARKYAASSPLPVELVEASAEELPFEDASFDTVVVAWSLCSIPHPARALSQARRVLRRGGRLLFAEHGLSPDLSVRRRQDRLTPLWRRIAGGCHLSRDVKLLVQQAGFKVADLETGYARGPRPTTYIYSGSAAAQDWR